MSTIKEIEARREVILDQMRAIRSMERGTINEHYVGVKHKGKKEPVARGPYYVISRRENNRTVGYHLKGKKELERVRRDVESRKRFVALCREFEQLTQRLGEIERADKGDEVEKKRRRSPSSRTGK